jgi:hypothetical protein
MTGISEDGKKLRAASFKDCRERFVEQETSVNEWAKCLHDRLRKEDGCN